MFSTGTGMAILTTWYITLWNTEDYLIIPVLEYCNRYGYGRYGHTRFVWLQRVRVLQYRYGHIDIVLRVPGFSMAILYSSTHEYSMVLQYAALPYVQQYPGSMIACYSSTRGNFNTDKIAIPGMAIGYTCVHSSTISI